MLRPVNAVRVLRSSLTTLSLCRPTSVATINTIRSLGSSSGHGHHDTGGAHVGPHHPVVPGTIGNRFEDRYWPAHDNVYRPPTIPRTTHYSMDHDLYFDDDVRPEPLLDNHNIGVAPWKMLARFAIACGTIGAGYFAANFYAQNFIGPHYMAPRRLPYDGLRLEYGGMDDRNYGHGEHVSTTRFYRWIVHRSGDSHLQYGEEKEVAAFAERRRAAAAAARGEQ